MNKKVSFFAMALSMLMLFTAVVPATVAIGNTGNFTAGSFLGAGPGLYGPILVEVHMSSPTRIDQVRVLSHDETHNTGNIPLELYPSLIVENQSLQIDIVAGATISSMAMLSAVRDAITRAGADPAVFTGRVTPYVPHTNTSADVVVIGAGGAGMTAAIHAAYEGVNVILLEKLGFVGGTTNYVIEAFGSVGNRTHLALGSPLNAETLTQTLITNNPNGSPEALSILAHNNGWAADWLRSIGAMMTVAGGQAAVQASREVGEIGPAMVSALRDEALHQGVDIRVNSRATGIITNASGAITGVRVQTPLGDYTINTSSVVVATGGFAANLEMVTEHRPDLEGFRYASSPGNRGDGHMMAQAMGANLGNMDHIRINYVYSTTPNQYFYYVASIVNTGAIVVNYAGERFMNDQAGHGQGPAMLAQGGSGWMVFDNTIVGSVREVRRLSNVEGLFVTANSLEELAQVTGINQAGLLNTIERYQGFVANGVDEDFNRPMLNMTFEKGPFHAVHLGLRVQGTFGGITTDTSARVLTPQGSVIPGLFAAGEVADDGTWGANPAAVNIVFGRIAGQEAAAFVR